MIMVTADIYLKVSRIVNLMEFPLHGMRNMSQIFFNLPYYSGIKV